MKTWILSFCLGFVLFLLFLFLTFPWQRLGPKMARETEKTLSNLLRDDYQCELRGFRLAFPIGVKMQNFKCANRRGEGLFEFEDFSMRMLPFHQRINANLGEGSLNLTANAGFDGKPSRVQLELEKVDLRRLMPLIFALNNALLFSTPVQLNVEGFVSGSADIPLQEFHKSSGNLHLEFDQLRLPNQLYLDLIGLRELKISPAIIDVSLEKGSLSLDQVALISSDLSAKAEGNMQLEEELGDSTGNIALKWKVQRSDALLSSPIGSQLLNTPCPSPDAQGFCTRRVTRLSEITGLFSPAGMMR